MALHSLAKHNWRLYRQILKDQRVERLYHFTDVRNLESIRTSGGLFSWEFCQELGIQAKLASSDNSRQMDQRMGLADYVRLSFCPDHPMGWHLRQAGRRLALLEIVPDVAWLYGTLYSDRNAVSAESQIGGNLEDLSRIHFETTQCRYLPKNSPEFPFKQAEVLVKGTVPAGCIVNLENPIYLEAA